MASEVWSNLFGPCLRLFVVIYWSMCILDSGNVHNACDTIIILFSLKMALGQKFGRTKIYTVEERSRV